VSDPEILKDTLAWYSRLNRGELALRDLSFGTLMKHLRILFAHIGPRKLPPVYQSHCPRCGTGVRLELDD